MGRSEWPQSRREVLLQDHHFMNRSGHPVTPDLEKQEHEPLCFQTELFFWREQRADVAAEGRAFPVSDDIMESD